VLSNHVGGAAKLPLLLADPLTNFNKRIPHPHDLLVVCHIDNKGCKATDL
jgi:hypothetical protein